MQRLDDIDREQKEALATMQRELADVMAGLKAQQDLNTQVPC